MSYRLERGKGAKKWTIHFPSGGQVSFGAKGYSDYTLAPKEKADSKKNAYIARHRVNEDWTKSGIKTAGFWARWLLWNQRTIEGSIRDIEHRFGVRISR